ncbi:MAG TPA: glycoside hydrolase N-terminal domain-containing protein, partial [Acidobacteriota bacterium]|nr:glycoside hydrolase N-terminal domain-containing protein [Acidobacteriota bacterium]
RRMTAKVPPLRWLNTGGRLLTGGWITACLLSCGQPTVEVNLPGPEDGLRYESPAEVWDEALPLGNGIMGALVWGDGHPLKISLDRSDLWDLRKVPEFYSEEYNFELMRQWHLEGKTEDLIRIYEDPYHRPAPTKIPAGRIELALGPDRAFTTADLSLIDATAAVTLTDLNVQVLVHAQEPVGMIRINSGKSP